MIKLITNSETENTLDIFCGVDGVYDKWSKNSPAIFEHIYKRYDSNNCYVEKKFSSVESKFFLLVFFKKDVDYYLSLRKFSNNDCGELNISVYDWSEKTPESNVMTLISEFSLNENDNCFHIMKVSRDTYYLFEMKATLGDESGRYAYLNFYKNIPTGGNYVTRYYRNWDSIDGSKWSYSGKVYSQRNLHGIERNKENIEYEPGAVLEFQSYHSENSKILFTSFDDVDKRFFPSKSTIIREFSVKERNKFLSEQEFNSGIIRIAGYLYSEIDVVKEVYVKCNEDVWIKINDQKFFINGREIEKRFFVNFNKRYNEIVAYQNISITELESESESDAYSSNELEIGIVNSYFQPFYIAARRNVDTLFNVLKETYTGDSFPALTNNGEFVLKIDLEVDVIMTKCFPSYAPQQFLYRIFNGLYQERLNLNVIFENQSSTLFFNYQDDCIEDVLSLPIEIPRETSVRNVILSSPQRHHFDFRIYIIRNTATCCLMVNNQSVYSFCSDSIRPIPETGVTKTCSTLANWEDYMTIDFNVKRAMLIPSCLNKKEILKCESIGLL